MNLVSGNTNTAIFCSLLLGVSKNHAESDKNVDGIHINSNTVVDWVVLLLSLGIIHNLLGVIQDVGTEKGESSIQPNVG